MELRETRKLISYILSFVMAFSLFVFVAGICVNATFSNQSFVVKNLVSDEAVSQCEAQLDSKYKALSAKSSIPVQVFENIMADGATKDNMTQVANSLYSEEEISFYSDAKIEYFYDMLSSYLDIYELNYNKDNLYNVADEAAQIYNDCVAISNSQIFKLKIEKINSLSSKVTSLSLMIAVAIVILTVMMYRDKKQAYPFFTSAVSASGVASVIVGVACLITKVSCNINLAPQVFANSVASIVNKFFVAMIIAGVIAIMIGFFAWLLCYKSANKNR